MSEEDIKEKVLDIFRKDPVKFVKLVCGKDMAEYQRDILLDDSKRIILNSGRQVGKSTIVSLKALWRAFCFPQVEILVLGPTERQAKIVFDKIYETIYLNEILMSETMKLTISEIRFKNGSVIRCLPAGRTGEYIRGFVADMVIVDEAAYVPDEVYVAIFPALAVRDGQLILMSTPKGREGFFFKAWESKEWSKYRVPTTKSPFVPDGFIEEYRMTHTEVDFRREILAEFVDYSEMWFDLDRVKELAKLSRKREPLEDYEYYMGVDIAASGTSETVVVVVGRHKYDENMPLEVHNYWYRSKFAITETVGWIKNLNMQWSPEQIIVDQTGLGIGARQLLSEKLDNVQGITFSSKMRYELYYNMKKLLEDKKVLLLDDQKMISQFDRYTTSYRSDGTITIKKAEGSDVVDALCLACWGAKKYTGAVVSVLDIEV